MENYLKESWNVVEKLLKMSVDFRAGFEKIMENVEKFMILRKVSEVAQLEFF